MQTKIYDRLEDLLKENKTHKMMIPNTLGISMAVIPAYIEGETSYSYLYALAEANGRKSYTAFYNDIHNQEDVIKGHDNPDCTNRIYTNSIRSAETDFDWLVESSIYRDLSPFLAPELVARKVKNSIYTSKMQNLLSPRASNILPDIKICPECMKEDLKHSRFQLHKIHQVPGVSICPVHGCHLMKYDKTKLSKSKLTKLENYLPLDESTWTQEDSLFLQDIMESKVNASLADTRNILYGKVCARYQTRDFMVEINRMLSADAELKTVTNSAVLDLLFRNYKLRTSIDKVIPFIRALYKNDSNAFITDLNVTSKFNEDIVQTSIPEGYELVSPINSTIIELMNEETGYRFPFTPQMLIDGWPMPDQEYEIDELTNRLVSRKLNNDWKILTPYSEWSQTMILEDPSSHRYVTTLKRLIEFGDVGKLDKSSALLDKYTKIVDSKGDYLLLATKGTNDTMRWKIRCLDCQAEFWVMAKDFERFPYCPICGKDTDAAEKAMAEAVSITTNKNFKWKGTLKEGIFKASAFKDGKKTIEASSCTELLRKLRFDKDGSKQETSIARAISHVIHMSVIDNPNKVFLVKDFLKYGLKRHVLEALKMMEAMGTIKSIENTLFYSSKLSPTKSDLIDAYYSTHEGIGIGDTLLRHIGYDIGTERYTYLRTKHGSMANKTVIEIFMGEIVTIRYITLRISESNPNSLALLATIENSNLMSHYGEKEISALKQWAKTNIKTPEYMPRAKAYFSEETIKKAMTMVGVTE